jgi:hypothetical protein
VKAGALKSILARYYFSFDPRSQWICQARVLGECFFVMTTVAVVLSPLEPFSDAAAEAMHDEYSRVFELFEKHWFLLGVLAMPMLETFLCQVLPYELTHRLTQRQWVGFLAMWFCFAAAHFTNSIASGVLAGIVGGFYLAIVYTVFRRVSLLRAITATFFQHAAQNFVVFALERF